MTSLKKIQENLSSNILSFDDQQALKGGKGRRRRRRKNKGGVNNNDLSFTPEVGLDTPPTDISIGASFDI